MMRKHGERVMLFCFRLVAAIVAVSRLFTFFMAYISRYAFSRANRVTLELLNFGTFFMLKLYDFETLLIFVR